MNIPGYSGHIPYKNEFIGLTTGSSNKAAEITYRGTNHPNSLSSYGNAIVNSSNAMSPPRSDAVDRRFETPEKGLAVSNLSKYSKTWLAGPQHEIKNQCIPGYTGFIPGVQAENVFSKSYSKNTNKSFNGKITRGHDLSPEKRFQTITQKKYNEKNFRRIVEKPDIASMRDYLEYTMTLNKDQKVNRVEFLSKSPGNAINPRGEYVDTSLTTFSPEKHQRDLNASPLAYHSKEIQVKPKLLEKGLATNKDFQCLPQGFQKIFAAD